MTLARAQSPSPAAPAGRRVLARAPAYRIRHGRAGPVAASLNDIHNILSTVRESVAGIGAKVEALKETVDEIKQDAATSERTSADSRANMHRRLDELVVRATNIESDVLSAKNRLEVVEKVTDDVLEMRQRAQGAGTLGRWLIRIGVGVVTLAGWLIGAYTYLTGRPPP